MKRVLGALCALGLVASVATAGDPKPTAAAPEKHDMKAAMMAEMAKCHVCSHMMPHLESLGPVMSTEVVHLNDGIAIMHDISDPAKLPEYRTVNAEMHAAGEKCMEMSDADAKTQLCSFCQAIRANMNAGATMSVGETKTGDMMILTSEDAAVQKSISDLGTKCAMMMEQM